MTIRNGKDIMRSNQSD